jgi:hypothetical protein
MHMSEKRNLAPVAVVMTTLSPKPDGPARLKPVKNIRKASLDTVFHATAIPAQGWNIWINAIEPSMA